MSRLLAIARLTFQEGVRMRIVLVFLLVLALIVLRLPFALRGDETLAGRLQTFLSYALTALSVLMGLATIFFSAATLCNEFRTRTIQMVVSKPVHRLELLIGKWLGVNALNVLMIAFTGLVVYGLAWFIKSRPEQFDRDRIKLDQVVWTARLAANPTQPDFTQAATAYIDAQIAAGEDFGQGRDGAIREFIRQLQQDWLQVPPETARVYRFEGLTPPASADTVYQVRFKARGQPLPYQETLRIDFGIVDPETGALLDQISSSERNAEMKEFLIRATGIVKDGKAELMIANPPVPRGGPAYPVTIYFEGPASLQILYKVDSFESNFVRALLLILFRLAFLSAVTLFFGTFVSFPVASFCVLSIYLFCIGAPFWLEAIGANAESLSPRTDPFGHLGPIIRGPLVFLIRTLLPDFFAYDGIEQLIDGYAIGLDRLLIAGLHTVGWGLLLLLAPGWLIFRGREVAGAAA